MTERFDLATCRIQEIINEQIVEEPFLIYFRETASFLASICQLAMANYGKNFEQFLEDIEAEDIEILIQKNEQLYRHLTKDYENSFLNPSYATKKLGEYGQVLSMLYTELYAMLPQVSNMVIQKEQSLFEITIRLELYLEIYTNFVVAKTEGMENLFKTCNETIYYFILDYNRDILLSRTTERFCTKESLIKKIINQGDLDKPNYLFAFGEYISKEQMEMVNYFSKQSLDKIEKMAKTYTNGYYMGFVRGKKDLSSKEIAQIVYPIGFEKMIRFAMEQFHEMGLESSFVTNGKSIIYKRGLGISGVYSSSPNKQWEYDHKEDEGLFLDKKLLSIKIASLKDSYEKNKEAAAKFAGPAWIELFGEENFNPTIKKECVNYTKNQQKQTVEYSIASGQILNEYMEAKNRSFTIIAFPTPEIGLNYEEIMDETIKLNNLDSNLYEEIQQELIDELDKGDYVYVEGNNGNQTSLTIQLASLSEAETQTKFENCVADVNIPVGEVFTSPVLKGTNGLLHVKNVFLNELEYKDLKLTFEDGVIVSYDCHNYEDVDKNKEFIEKNLLLHRKNLPMGEFAIGTNTIAYTMGRKYNIADKLPILIAEKTGPHFAIGDTCYSHNEDEPVYNSDGKEVIARDNEISILRKVDQSKAYFQVHTDITISYDQLGVIQAKKQDGTSVDIIRNGRFVLGKSVLLNDGFDNTY